MKYSFISYLNKDFLNVYYVLDIRTDRDERQENKTVKILAFMECTV